MKKVFQLKGLLFLFFLVFHQLVYSQPNWQYVNSSGGTGADVVFIKSAVDASGNNYYTGSFVGSATIGGTSVSATGGSSDADIFVAKFDKNGNTVWVRTLGGTGSDAGRGITVDGSGNVYVTGNYTSSSITYAGTTVNNALSGINDMFILRVNADGSAGWIKSYGSTGNDVATPAVYDAVSGYIFLAGHYTGTVAFGTTATYSSTGGTDIFIMEMSTAGALQWVKSGGSTGADTPYGIAVDNSSNIYTTGVVQGNTTFGTVSVTGGGGGQDIVITQHNSAGTANWVRMVGGTSNDYGFGIAYTSTGKLNVTGYFQNTATFGTQPALTSAGGLDVFVAQYNTSGTALWSQKFGSTGDDAGYDLAVDAASNMYVSGKFTGSISFGTLPALTSSGLGDAFLVKLDDLGTPIYSVKAGGTGDDVGQTVAVDNASRIYWSGNYTGTAAFGNSSLTSAGGNDMFFAGLNTGYTWTGNTSTAWNIPTNWNPVGVPGAGDIVNIVNATNAPSTVSPVTVDMLNVTGGTLNGTSSNPITVSSFSYFNGGTVNVPITSNGIQAKFSGGTAFQSAYTANCADIYLDGASFYGTTNITKIGSLDNISKGGNQFISVTLTNTGSGKFILGNVNSDGFYSTAVFNKQGTGSLWIGYNSDCSFQGDIICNNGVVNLGGVSGSNKNFTISGPSTQTIAGTGSILATYFWLNKGGPNPGDLNVNIPVTVNNSLTFSSASRINNPNNVLTFGNGAACTGADNFRYITGPVKKIGNTSFTFPIGSGASYMPFTIGAPATTTDAFQVQAFAATPQYNTNLAAPLVGIQPMYWNMSRISGASAVTLKMYWNTSTPGQAYPDYETAAMLSGAQWVGVTSTPELSNYVVDGDVVTTSTYSGGTFALGYTAAVLPICTNTDITRNWVQKRTFDANGNVISESRTYSDNMGRAIQTQTRNVVEGKVLATATVLDAMGRPAITTLPAPISTSCCFLYQDNFVASSATYTAYAPADFDKPVTALNASGEINNPITVQPVPYTLGWYYSYLNTMEPYVPGSSYPYGRVTYSDAIGGGVIRYSAPGDALRMGQGHEVSTVKLPILWELNHYIKLRNFYVPGIAGQNIPSDLSFKGTKTISRDQNGNEVVSFYNKEGQLLATAMAGVRKSPDTDVLTQNKYSNYSNYYSFTFSPCTTNCGTSASYFSIAGTGNVEIYLNRDFSTPYYIGPVSGAPSGPLAFPTSEVFIHASSPFTVTNQSASFSSAAWNGGIPVSASSYIDIHIPSGNQASLAISGSGYTIYDLFTGLTVPLASITPGFYRIITTTPISVNYNLTYYNFTYYYYNDVGQLVATVAPNGINVASTSSPSFVSTKEYNTVGWTMASTNPDEGRQEFVYRTDGLVRFSQNAFQATQSRFSYINYDGICRPVESGEYYFGGNTSPSNVWSYYKSNPLAVLAGASNCSDVSYTLYDVPDASGLSAAVSGYTQRLVNSTVSRTSKKALGSDAVNVSTTWYSYDEMGHPEWTVQSLNGLGAKTVDYQYDLDGKLVKKIYMKNSVAERFDHWYTYDLMARLSQVSTSRDGTNWNLNGKYSYYLHGPLKRKELGGNLQGIDYTYTIQGKLKAINHPNLDNTDPGADSYSGIHSTFQKDAFGMILEYYDNDYSRNGYFSYTNNLTTLGYGQFYNGNIRSATWNTQPTDGLAPRQYVYKYDKKYQLLQADFGDHVISGNTFSKSNNSTSGLNKSSEYNIAYDDNGNIMQMYRTDQNGSVSFSSTYSYNLPGSNKLTGTTDPGGSGNTRTFGYDAIGRMTSCSTSTALGEGNKYVDYNYAGLVKEVYSDATKTQKVASFLYDEVGQRIRKTSYSTAFPNGTNYTWYVRDASGEVLSIYNTDLAVTPNVTVQMELPVYGSGREGVYYANVSEYDYELTDHLGNVRVTVRLNSSTHLFELAGYADYYPFGSRMGGTRFKVAAPAYRNGYQGQYSERDNETNWENFELRMYDANLGRWFSPDPYNQYYSPYLAMSNNPALTVDPDGGKGLDWYLNEQTGKYEWIPGSADLSDWHLIRQGDITFVPPKFMIDPTHTPKEYEFHSNADYQKSYFGYENKVEVDYTLESYYIPLTKWLKLPQKVANIGYSPLSAARLGFAELQAICRKNSFVLNAFFKTEGNFIPKKQLLLYYRELTIRILTGKGGAKASQATERAIEVQTQRLELIDKILKSLE